MQYTIMRGAIRDHQHAMEWSHHPQSARTQRRDERHEPRLQLGDAHHFELNLLDGGPRAVLGAIGQLRDPGENLGAFGQAGGAAHAWKVKLSGHREGTWRASMTIRGHQRPSEAIRGHQWPSVVIRGHQ